VLQIFIQPALHFEWLESGDQRSQRLVILDFHVFNCDKRSQQLDVLLSLFELPGRHIIKFLVAAVG